MKALTEGFEIKKYFTVSKTDTAAYVGSGGLEVLATPTLSCWVEMAAYELVQFNLEEENTSVGTKFDINHIAPTSIDSKVTVDIIVKEIQNRRILFTFKAFDEVQEIANGIHERVIVNKEKFLSKLK